MRTFRDSYELRVRGSSPLLRTFSFFLFLGGTYILPYKMKFFKNECQFIEIGHYSV